MSRLFTVLIIERLRLETVLLRPSEIHPHQHLRPVLRFGAAGAGMNIHDRVQPIVLAREKNLRLDAIDECFVLIQARYKLIADRLALTRKFHKSLQVFELAGYLAAEIERFLQTGALAQDLAGTFLVGIEVGFGDLLLEFIELSLLAVDVKETSALPHCEF